MPKLVVTKGPVKGKAFSFKGGAVFVGRSSRNDIKIKDNTISRKQFKIFSIGKRFFAEDLKSTNGTLINGERIEPGEGFELGEGDIISIGSTVIRLSEFPSGNGLAVRELGSQRPKVDSSEIRQPWLMRGYPMLCYWCAISGRTHGTALVNNVTSTEWISPWKY